MTLQGGNNVARAAAVGDAVDPWIGRVIGDRYRVEKRIGDGSSGTVYLAEHVTLNEKVAVKILHPSLSQSPELLQRFEREAKAAAKMRHPNVVAAIDFGQEPDGTFYLVLEYVEGTTLRDAIEAGMFDPLRATQCLRQIAMALERAHGMGVVHRDLKPENVVLSRTPEGEEVSKVLDFGIAKVPHLFGSQGKVSTQRGMIYGTPEYMAPEQALGQEVEARADLYALGVIAYELYVGKRPFDDENKVALLGKHITATIPPFLDRNPMLRLPPLVEPLVRSLLAKNLNDRASDAKSVREELDRIVFALMPPGSSPAEYISPLSAAPPAADSRPLGALLHKTSEGLKNFS
ncbi:MAG: serine/threonine protein kinase, partial [Polyangiaceae bacterium]|nr:serine/threonine protein kinase [Polyangiaceae bacterium]